MTNNVSWTPDWADNGNTRKRKKNVTRLPKESAKGTGLVMRRRVVAGETGLIRVNNSVRYGARVSMGLGAA